MNRINLEQDIKPLSEFRAHAAALLEQIHQTKRPLVITQHGKSAGVVLDVGVYESLMERLEVLNDIQLAEQEIREGKTIDNETARTMLLAELEQ